MGDCTAAENATRHRDHSQIGRSAAAEDETKQMLIVDANFLKGQVVKNWVDTRSNEGERKFTGSRSAISTYIEEAHCDNYKRF